MKYTRRPLFLDKFEITLSIERAEAQIIYGRVNKYWDLYGTKPWKPKGAKKRYKYRYRMLIDKSLHIFLYLVPIGPGQSSIKLEFNPYYLSEARVKLLRKMLLKLLGLPNCLRLYREAIVTRIDSAIDYQHMEITDYHYFCVGPNACDDSYSSTLYLGAKSSSRFWRIYRKDKEELDKRGFTDYKYPVLRFERMVRPRVSMAKLHELANPFNKLHALQFDADDPDFIKLFIESRADNQEHRRRFIDKLKNHCLHEAIRQFSSEGERNVILTALKPYRVDLFPDNTVWSRELNRALGFIRQLKPRAERLKLKHTVPAVDHCESNVPVTCKLMYENRVGV
jgi:hypothetical protein